MKEKRWIIWAILLMVLVALAFHLGVWATLAAPAEPRENVSVVGVAFCDTDNNGFYQVGVDDLIEGARLTLVLPDNSRHPALTNSLGHAFFNVSFDPAAGEAFIEVEYPAGYQGWTLVPSPDDNARKVIVGPLGSAFVAFRAIPYQPTGE